MQPPSELAAHIELVGRATDDRPKCIALRAADTVRRRSEIGLLDFAAIGSPHSILSNHVKVKSCMRNNRGMPLATSSGQSRIVV
jgi:hypothetical protein